MDARKTSKEIEPPKEWAGFSPSTVSTGDSAVATDDEPAAPLPRYPLRSNSQSQHLLHSPLRTPHHPRRITSTLQTMYLYTNYKCFHIYKKDKFRRVCMPKWDPLVGVNSKSGNYCPSSEYQDFEGRIKTMSTVMFRTKLV